MDLSLLSGNNDTQSQVYNGGIHPAFGDFVAPKASVVDMGLLGVPTENLGVSPFSPGERSEMTPGARWLNKLTIEWNVLAALLRGELHAGKSVFMKPS